MSAELRDTIAQVHRDHTFRITGESDQPMCCECQEGCSGPDGWMLTMDPGEHPAHVADAVLAILNDNALAVVKLPRGEVNPDAWANQAGGVTLRNNPNSVSNFTVLRAREISAALLAAAEAAEVDRPPLIVDHFYLPVAGHPDDDECTYRPDGSDATYCGERHERHLS